MRGRLIRRINTVHYSTSRTSASLSHTLESRMPSRRWLAVLVLLMLDGVAMDGLVCRDAIYGDILVRPVRSSGEGRRREIRAATAFKKNLWINNTIPYVIGPFFTNATRVNIHKAMTRWEKHTCLQFVPRTSQKDYIEIRLKPGCCSSIGRVGGRQEVFLGYGCHTIPTILHELGHVIGFWHEQMRPDRDDYVEVLHENIVPGEKHNFAKLQRNAINSLDQIFDYESIMLYGTGTFSSNARRTLKAKLTRYIWRQQGRVDYFQLHTKRGATRLSARDIIQTNLLYKCPLIHENGGILVDPQGSLMSPNYPKPYPRSRDYTWSIVPRRMHAHDVLTLLFDEFSVGAAERNGNCASGHYLEIREGMGELAPYLVKLCGSKAPFVISVPRDSLFLKLHSPNSSVVMPTTEPSPVSARLLRRRRVKANEFKPFVFAMRYRVTADCYFVLKNLSGSLQSPFYPSPYPTGTDCIWQITVPPGYRIQVTFNDFDFRQVNRESGCTDFLEMREGDKATSLLVSVHCGRDFPSPFTTTGNHLRLAMHSREGKDAMHSRAGKGGAGFIASYQAVDVDECTENGVNPCEQGCLNEPGTYFCGCYEGYFTVRDNPKHVNCVDIDECEDDNGGCSHNCTNTYGGFFCSCPAGFYLDKNDRTCKDSDECKLSLCSHTCINTPGSYRCSCRYGYLLDSDDRSCVLAIPMCTGLLTSPVGRFHSPAVPSWYRGLVKCEWLIRVRQRYTIGAYLSLDWSRDRKCRNYLKVSWDEGLGTRSLKFCGREDMEGLGLLHFKAHDIRVFYHVQAPYPEGFSLRYHMRPKKEDLCGGTLNSPKGRIESPGYPSSYPSRVVCLWKVLNLRSRHIVLSFDTFRLERESHCKYDYVDIQAKHGDSSRLIPIGRFCGAVKPPQIKVKATEIWVTFRSDGTVQKRGFRARYTLV